jgi:hypothetical protein
LIEADSIRYREMQAARMKGDRSGDNTGYVFLYMSAVMAADPEHGDEVLLEMLSEPQYERFVAETLVRSARKNQGPPTLGINHPEFRKVWAAREEKRDGRIRRGSAEPLRGRASDARRDNSRGTRGATDKRPSEYRLKPIGTFLAALDARRSAKLILEVMAFPAGYDA